MNEPLLPLTVVMGTLYGMSSLQVTAHAAESDEHRAEREIIIQSERQLTQAYVSGDDRVLSRLLSEHFRGIGPRGTSVGKAEALEGVRHDRDESAAEAVAIDVQIDGDTAIARVTEKQTGLAPELKPAWRVITDTWIKRAGKWRVIAAEELDPGSPTLPENASAIADIRALREASNRAIAAHDLAAFVPLFAEDAAFIWSNGTSAVGRSGLSTVFARDFSDPAFVTYVRTPESISIADAGVRAVEHGTWTAIKREPRGETRYGGDYMAHWFKTAEGWQVRGEVYVKLRCVGPLCTP